MQEAGTKLQAEKARTPSIEQEPALDATQTEQHLRSVERLRSLWEERRFLFKSMVGGSLLGLLLSFSIPKQ